MAFNFDNFINNFKLIDDDKQPNIEYNDVYDNYMCDSDYDLHCEFDQIVLDPNLAYKKVEESTFEEQWNYLLKQDMLVKSRIEALKKKINNYLYSNIKDDIPIHGNIILNTKLVKIKSDFDMLNGILQFTDTTNKDRIMIAKQYYDNLKQTHEYELINRYYSENYSKFCKNTIITNSEPIEWISTVPEKITVKMRYIIKSGSDSYILIKIDKNVTTLLYKIVNNEKYNLEELLKNNQFVNYLILPILQIIHNIKLLKTVDEQAKWYIILDKLIKIYRIFNPSII